MTPPPPPPPWPQPQGTPQPAPQTTLPPAPLHSRGAPPPAPPLGTAFSEAPRYSYPGTNGLAIAAFICGLLGFVLPAFILSLISLRKLKRHGRTQKGRGLAIAGLVLASLWVALIIALWAFATPSSAGRAPQRDSGGQVTAAGKVEVGQLQAGDCFDGITEGTIERVTVRPCREPHEAQLALVTTLPPGTFPGADEASDQAEQLCLARADAAVAEDRLDDVSLVTLYPNTDRAWRTDRSVMCVVTPSDKQPTTGSVLK
ncbi:DUF4190 domain-containing protein [Intrasporangium mesophilum]